MDNGVLIGITSAISALAGAGLTQWGAMRTARMQAAEAERREALQWERQSRDKQEDALMAKDEMDRAREDLRAAENRSREEKLEASQGARREEFLGWVLLAESRTQDRLSRFHRSAGESQVETSGEPPVSCARKAYAVALLYLAELRPLAKVFYEAVAGLHLALDENDNDAAIQQSRAWKQSFLRIEEALAGDGQKGP